MFSAYIFTFPSSVISESALPFYLYHHNSIPLSCDFFLPSIFLHSTCSSDHLFSVLNCILGLGHLSLCFQLTQSISVLLSYNFLLSSINVKHLHPFFWYLEHFFASKVLIWLCLVQTVGDAPVCVSLHFIYMKQFF